MRRPVAVCLVVLLAAISFGQRRDGTFQQTPWSINDNHTLIWGGVPYVPRGVQVDGNPGAVASANAANIHDLLVDLPAGGANWAETLTALEAEKSRYVIRLNSLAPMSEGFAIEPQGYRISNILEPRTVTVDLPGASTALVILASQRDGKIDKRERVPVINGKLTYEADPGPQVAHVLLIYPEMASLSLPDYWDKFDAHRDTLLATLKRSPLGPGMRGIINPLGKTATLANERERFVPTSNVFRLELRNYLEQKYKSVQTLTRSWSIVGSDLQTFEAISRLVPLWSGERGIPSLFDPATNKVYASDRRYSSVWADIQAVINMAAAKRYARLVDSIRDVADVPVIQEWNGWALPYENQNPQIDGIGMQSVGTTPSQIIESACRATSSLLRWNSRGWLLATSIEVGGSDAAQQLAPVVGDLASLGARGFYLQSQDPALVAAFAKVDVSAVSDLGAPTAIFYPENATNPANPQRLANGNWWLPTPVDGNRLDLGTNFFGYRTPDQVAIWAKVPGRYKLRMKEPKKAAFLTVDGSDPKPKVGKTDIEVTLTEMPLLIQGIQEVPIPEVAFNETVKQFAELVDAATTNHRDTTQERLLFADHLKYFETDPGANFPFLREQVYMVAYRLADFLWLEAERPTTTNFSEIRALPGASSQGALVLDTRIASGDKEGYFAEYQVPVLSGAEQEIWVAANVPAERRGDVTVVVGGQAIPFPKDYVSLYGQGLAWYKIGTTVFKGNLTKVRLQVSSPGTPIAFDIICITPIPFTPTATTPPMPRTQNQSK